MAAGVVATAPAIWHVGSHFMAGGAPGYGEAAAGDHLQSVYRLWLVGDDLEHGRSPWRDPYSFRPEAHWQLNPAGWPFGFVFWPLWRALGLVLAWNVFVLLTFLAAGGLACAWLRELGLPRGPALAGGLAFAIAPYRVAQSAGHMLGATSVLLPLALLAFERGRRSSRWWLILSVAALASIPLSGQVHLALGATPFFLAYALVRTRARLPVITAVAAVAAAVGAGLVIRYEVIAGSISAHGRSLSAVSFYSAGWLDFLDRSQRHGLEPFVFLGWATPAAALSGLVLVWRRGRRPLAALLGLSAAVPMLLALGTSTPLYRAARFLFPPLRYPRVPERLMPIACLVLAALVAFAVTEAAERGSSRVPRVRRVSGGAATVSLCVLLLFLDLRVTTFHATAAGASNRAYAALRGHSGRLLELPVFRPGAHYGGVYMYYDTQVRLQRPEGYSTTAPVVADTTAAQLLPLNCGDWPPEEQATLHRLGVRAIAFHRGLFEASPTGDTAWFAWRALVRHGWKRLSRDGAVTTMLRKGWVPPSPAREPSHDQVVFCDGWYANDGHGRQASLGHAALWVYDSGDFRLFVSADAPLRVHLSVDGRPVGTHTVFRLRELRVPVGGRGWHLIAFDSTLVESNGRAGGARLVGYARS
jgi:hypothetical protein